MVQVVPHMNLECPTQMTVEAAVQNTKGASLQSEGLIFCYIRLENDVLSFMQYIYTLKCIFFWEHVA